MPETRPRACPLRGVWTVYKRELGEFLVSPGAYVALAFFLLLAGAVFVSLVGDFAEASLEAMQGVEQAENELPLNITERVVTLLFKLLNFLMLLVIPMLTMRLLAEEKSSGRFELLVSTPLRDRDILLGKYLAALTVGLVPLALSLVYPLLLDAYSAPEWPVVAACYLGLFCILAAYTAFGLFASSLTESQIAAGVLGFAGLLLLQLVDQLFKAGLLGTIAGGLSLSHHAEAFTRGRILSTDLAYFACFTVFFLFMTAQVMDARRYRA